jgi:surface antigen
MMKSQIALSLIAVLLLSACSTTSGAKGGGTFARLTGKSSQPATSGVLAPLGNGLLGSRLAASLDPADRKSALQAEYQALEYSPAGKAVDWKNSSGSRSGEVVAAQPYQVGSQNCRQYTHTIRIDGTPQTSRGTACRNEDGSWTPLI